MIQVPITRSRRRGRARCDTTWPGACSSRQHLDDFRQQHSARIELHVCMVGVVPRVLAHGHVDRGLISHFEAIPGDAESEYRKMTLNGENARTRWVAVRGGLCPRRRSSWAASQPPADRGCIAIRHLAARTADGRSPDHVPGVPGVAPARGPGQRLDGDNAAGRPHGFSLAVLPHFRPHQARALGHDAHVGIDAHVA